MEALALRYVADIERDLVMTQGISAQSSRTRRRRGTTMPQNTPSFSPTPTLTTRSATAHSWSVDPPVLRPRDSTLTPAIPLHRLLPKSRPPTTAAAASDATASWKHLSTGRLLTSQSCSMALSPNCQAPRAVSLSPRFFDAHVEYIGRDCVIHNGMQIIDVKIEFAQQRAAPRLINFPH
ncbi:hypothetical protein LPJ53_001549 [Coemansia erecta]|uniref:Uncharacterized protein n=1 Tax=Coemansia erecta TaxID=147472 RepID=A0A9W8CUR8_9FUNG|nr:hypothetical protein LPJ53_001549 [Coemansia erecta]